MLIERSDSLPVILRQAVWGSVMPTDDEASEERGEKITDHASDRWEGISNQSPLCYLQ